ncbi:MAG TPA: flagellar filament capping protein FliD [Clostridiales bacterium]|nr:flagellar filament capping protein FliD [Clostridiales bacterium]
MPIRLSGMMSGLDTDTLIKGIMDAERFKNKRVSDKQTLLTWKQDKWKELNTKLYKLYTDELSKVKMQGNYLTKKASPADNKILDVKANNNAPAGTHAIKVIELASAKFVTGEKINSSEGVSSNTKLTELGIADATLINFKYKGKEVTLDVNANTTMQELVDKAKSIGLNANFDNTQKRLFISSKDSGIENDFEINTTTSLLTAPKREVYDLVDYSSLSLDNKNKVDKNLSILRSTTSTETAKNKAINELNNFAIKKSERDVDKTIAEDVRLRSDEIKDIERNLIRGEVMQREIILLKEAARKEGKSEEEIDAINEMSISTEERERIEGLQDVEIGKSSTRLENAVKKVIADTIQEEKDKADGGLYEIKSDEAVLNLNGKINNYINMGDESPTQTSGILENIGLGASAKVVEAQDAVFMLNNAEMTSSSNNVTVNGLSLTLKTVGDTNITVSSDADAVYDNIKNFVNSYNEILKEMNALHNAELVKGYAPLSDEEKEQMTESQIEKWETKIQDSILRRDDGLGSLINVMRNALNTSIEIDGKRYSLSSLGITTSSDYTERGLLHIQGDEDFPKYSGGQNKLREMLEEDPEKLMKIMTGITSDLYDSMNEKMKAIPNMRSALTFYNDKTMTKQITDYGKEVSKLEKKLIALENKYYKQFAAMETAMAKLQSQSSALASMLGMNTNNNNQ